MTVGTNTVRIDWIKYDNRDAADTYRDYQAVNYMPFEEFLAMQNSLREQDSDVGQMTVSMNSENHEVMYRTDRHPTWYTVINNTQIIFDAYDVDTDDTLKKERTLCGGWVYPSWTHTDAFAPPLEPAQFSYWINKAKARAFNELKQQANQEAIAEARTQKIRIQKHRDKVRRDPAIMQTPRYGRR
jgi:hypothetical protein